MALGLKMEDTLLSTCYVIGSKEQLAQHSALAPLSRVSDILEISNQTSQPIVLRTALFMPLSPDPSLYMGSDERGTK